NAVALVELVQAIEQRPERAGVPGHEGHEAGVATQDHDPAVLDVAAFLGDELRDFGHEPEAVWLRGRQQEEFTLGHAGLPSPRMVGRRVGYLSLTLAQESLSATVRLKTNAPSRESTGSLMKYPVRSNL